MLAGYVIGFADGTGDHVRWMLHGAIHAYPVSYPPVPIQVLFVGLLVLDPVPAVLTGLTRHEGVWLACAIMVADMIANWTGNLARITSPQGPLLDTVPWLITIFGLFVLGTALPMTPVLRRADATGTVSPFQAA